MQALLKSFQEIAFIQNLSILVLTKNETSIFKNFNIVRPKHN